jgi:type II secretory pathway predicted ATPase ExeA
MYEAHFNLGRKPFATYPEPDMMYWAEGHKMARTMLIYGLTATNGIVVITGEIGSGKTTLLSDIIARNESGHVLGRLNGAIGLGSDVAAWVLYGFGIETGSVSATTSMGQLQEFLRQTQARGRKAVLFIDEAQLLSEAVIEELRLLSDMQIGMVPVLQLVMLGQPELANKLNSPNLLQFRQRIVSHYHLKAFAPTETREYVVSRLHKAGGTEALITPEAMEGIHAQTDGIPRRINKLCDTAFVYAYAQGMDRVSKEVIEKVISDRGDHGLLAID